VVTVSDTRTLATDRSGRLLRAALERAGHAVVESIIVKDDPKCLGSRLRSIHRRNRARVIVMSGGTGIAPRDRTFEAIDAPRERLPDWASCSDAELPRGRFGGVSQPGDGRRLARAGPVPQPGSPDAVRLMMRRLILPELRTSRVGEPGARRPIVSVRPEMDPAAVASDLRGRVEGTCTSTTWGARSTAPPPASTRFVRWGRGRGTRPTLVVLDYARRHGIPITARRRLGARRSTLAGAS
jgi:molybdenum cofactor biosynthesis protein B